MKIYIIAVLGIFTLFLGQNVLAKKVSKNSTANSRVILSSYIKSGKLEEAKVASLINWGRESLDGIPSYSGFFTVNETTNSNLFFWFVPAMVEDPEDAPLILWLNSPSSSLYGLFLENGPFKVKKRGRIPKLVLRVRKDTWARRHNMLYIDSPVGSGFSFTDNEEGYATSQKDIANNLYSALEQFFTIFSEFSKQDLYLAGESYAAKTIPLLGVKIHEENQQQNATKINFKGMITGGPLTDPQSFTNHYADYYYYLGLIDEAGRAHIKSQEQLITKLIADRKPLEAQRVREELLFAQNSTAEYPSYLTNATGYEYFATALETRTTKKRFYFTRFLNQTSTRKLIHVGEQPFNNVSSSVATSFFNDLEFSSKAQMEQLLNLKYRVLIYVGQMDLITPHVGVANFIRSMDFEGKPEFEKSERRIMRDLKRGDVSGYVKAHANLFYVVVRNAGHHAPSDEPRWCREMVEKFISGTSDEDF